jgi:Kef-type K+ transport system membrane component KefB/Trk K+ transport system NAD-binding subunit
LILAVLIISFIARLLKQPIIIAYIVTGILISPFFLDIISKSETVQTFSQMGVAFLLFIVGLHLNPRVIKEVGFVSIVVGTIQIALTALAGYYIAYLLGFSVIASLYIAFALTFSSTIIITKILSDKADLDTLYGKISVGILILQDIIVIFILLFLSYSSKGFQWSMSPNSILYTIMALIFLVFMSMYILPSITKFVARNQELLLLFSIGWCFLLASLFFYLFKSMEIGALIAGMSLSLSPYHEEISSKVRPLRDFFIVIFFVLLGLNLPINTISSIIKPALIFSAFVIIFKFLVITISMGIAGYTKRTGFFTGTSLGQISEFSFILIALAVSLGHIPKTISSIITLTGIITIAFSTYTMIYSNKIFPLFSPALSILERKKVKERELKKKEYSFILFGYNRIGFSLLKTLTHLKRKYIVVDFNPETIKKLEAKKIESVYGDAQDTEFLQDLRIDKAKLVISTIPEFEINLLILNKIRKTNDKSIVILTAHRIDDALKLYEEGADYIIMPHFLGGQYTAKIVEKFKTNKRAYKREKQKQIENLQERLEEGHEHPETEKHLQ